MARKPTSFPKNGVQMNEYVWTKNMTKKDRGLCKTYIDGLLSDIEKRDRDIIDLGNVIKNFKKDFGKIKCEDVENKNRIIEKQMNEITRLRRENKGINSCKYVLSVISIILLLVSISLGYLYLAH